MIEVGEVGRGVWVLNTNSQSGLSIRNIIKYMKEKITIMIKNNIVAFT